MRRWVQVTNRDACALVLEVVLPGLGWGRLGAVLVVGRLVKWTDGVLGRDRMC